MKWLSLHWTQLTSFYPVGHLLWVSLKQLKKLPLWKFFKITSKGEIRLGWNTETANAILPAPDSQEAILTVSSEPHKRTAHKS